MASVLILTFASGKWYPDKKTSSSKNFVLAVTLELSLERKKRAVLSNMVLLKKIWMENI